jgi:hypothetical protein
MALASADFRPDSSTTRARRWTRSEGMSIRIGQASKQAPHNEEA